MEMQVFQYENQAITFQNSDGNVMVNATQMAKPFNKRAFDWLKTKQTKEFLDALSASKIIEPIDLVITKNGGVNFGTWMHEDVALEFARWLSPHFAIWCNEHIKKLLNTGTTSIGDLTEDELILKAMQKLQGRVAQAQALLEDAQNTLQEQAPKVEYHDEVLQSKATHTITTIAKELGMSAMKLNKTLHLKGVIYKHQDNWVLYAKYDNRGLTKTNTYSFYDSRGILQTSIRTVWTEKGRKFIHGLMKDTLIM